ncbi:methanogenesis marker 12 protein [Methanolapillus ohkumae]|uniref:methanogenesis marker 12 protein n=1 Tax=Methanolapillus ohkumae TaxID=3028298 RepID=UPI0030B906F5
MGFDHGTSAIRFALICANGTLLFEIPRPSAGAMEKSRLLKVIEENLGIPLSDVEMACVTYSMGDGISDILPIHQVTNRGVLNTSGVGETTGAGTKVFDILLEAGCPAVVLPGLHQKSPADRRMSFFSHQAGPEKIGTAYHACKAGYRNFILSDIGSNTVTMAVVAPKILGAIDACIFAPGTRHGPLDVAALRKIDRGEISANQAFSMAGAGSRLDVISLFAAMEISALDVLMKDYKISNYDILISGTGAENEEIFKSVSTLIQKPAEPLGKWAAAIGCAQIAQDIAGGQRTIFEMNVKV